MVMHSFRPMYYIDGSKMDSRLHQAQVPYGCYVCTNIPKFDIIATASHWILTDQRIS